MLGAALAALWRVRRAAGAGCCSLVPLAVNLAGVSRRSIRSQAFQSPYWDQLPADNAPLLAALRAEGVAARLDEPLGWPAG